MAAERGNISAQFKLGAMYYKGEVEGVTQDYKEAAKWFRMAAEQEDFVAQRSLGLMYMEGQGVPKDYIIAHAWFNLATSRGFDLAKSNRDKIAEDMTPSQIAEAQALAKEWAAKYNE